MNMLLSTVKLDVRLQARSQLYAIGVFVAVLLGFAGRFVVHPEYAGRVLAVFYLTGIGSTTYMFGASLLLLEKGEGTLQALRTTPLTSTAYLLSKVITLTTFAMLESVIVLVVAFWGIHLNPVPMIFGVACLGAFYTLVGLGQAASKNSITAFLFPGAVIVTAILQLPMFHVITGPFPLWYVLPTQGPMLLMLGGSEPLENWQWVYAIVMSMVSILWAFWWAKSRFADLVKLQEG